MSKLAEIEALLFVAGRRELLPDKSQIFSLYPPTGVVQSLENSAQATRRIQIPVLCLMETASRYKLVTKADYASVFYETILERHELKFV